MKANKILGIIAFLFITSGIYKSTQAAELKNMIVSVKYFMFNNKIPFVQISSKIKIDKKLQPVPGINFVIYLDSSTDNHLIGKVKTNDLGDATIAVPLALKTSWDASPKHTIICSSAANKEYDETENELEITQAKLQLDTLIADDARSITATLMEKTTTGWIPVKETDIKVGVKRLGGILSAGSDESFTTDDKGVATAAFEREKLPGDKNGNLMLIAKLEDNETYGNLIVEMKAPWGSKIINGHNAFEDRSLWATRAKAPYWLLILANSIIVIVWGVIIYLVIQIFKIRKLGASSNV